MKKDYILVQKKNKIHFIPNAYVIGRVYAYSMKKLFKGRSFGPTLALYKNGTMYWYASLSGLKAVSQVSFQMIKNDHEIVKKTISKFKKLAPDLLKFTSKIVKTDFNQVSNQQLHHWFEKYLYLYEAAYLQSEPMVLSFNDALADYLKVYLKKISINKNKALQNYNLLIAPQNKSFVKREEDELLKIAQQIVKGKIKNKKEAIKKHTNEFFWVPYDYGVYIWDEKYFEKILEKMIKQRNIDKDLEKSKKYFTELTRQQTQCQYKLHIDSYHKNLFHCLRQAAFLLDYKKEIFTQVHYYIAMFLEEIGRRFGVSRELIQYYLPAELETALIKDKKVSNDVLKNRYRQSLAYWHDDKVDLLLGKKANKFLSSHLKQDESPPAFLEGIIASTGKLFGVVKVVHSVNEAKKVKQGDILVASMTSPEYVPAMRKAGAVITDEGGVTCHAAIVSRELGIPCVVGTGNATKVLKDGDLIEVNANHNSVRIIKK